jgi:hypothetical protein
MRSRFSDVECAMVIHPPRLRALPPRLTPWIKKLQNLRNQVLKLLGILLNRSLSTKLSPTLVASGTVGTVWQRWF